MTADVQVESVRTDALHPNPRNARTHSTKQIKQIADSIVLFGFLVVILALRSGEIISGHGRWLAAKKLGLEFVPVRYVDHLAEAQVRAFMIADNRIAENAGWDKKLLADEFLELETAQITLDVTGFSISERDSIIDVTQDASPTRRVRNEDKIVEPNGAAVTLRGDTYLLGRHRLLCGNALEADSYGTLMREQRARMVFTDPPYNVPIDGFTGGLGQVKHREFEMAAGEMDEEQFTSFLATSLGHMASWSVDGAILFACMDWRHAAEMIAAGRRANLVYKQLITWVKKNGGMGTFYRSRHELVFVFKSGDAAHVNTFGLGDTGRYRTNVWEYAGVNTFNKTRMEDLTCHPTVKSTAMVRDAILDVSERGDIVLDPFAGSGTTLIAAETCGRTAYIMELDPLYCDVICRRFQRVTGEAPVRESDGSKFDDLEALDATQENA